MQAARELSLSRPGSKAWSGLTVAVGLVASQSPERSVEGAVGMSLRMGVVGETVSLFQCVFHHLSSSCPFVLLFRQ